MGCEFALPFVFSPYFPDTYGGKGHYFFINALLSWEKTYLYSINNTRQLKHKNVFIRVTINII